MKNLISKEEKDQIDLICKEYKIRNYSINSNGSIDVDGHVRLNEKNLDRLPLRFGKVTGNFFINFNSLTSLDGCPVTVGGVFVCAYNELTSLVGAPITIGGDFFCSNNELTTLEGTPVTINGDYYCINNNIISTYCGDIDIDLNGEFHIDVVWSRDIKLPQLLKDNMDHINLILKYQRHFEIWNEDLSLNEENLQMLLDEIKDGLQ